MFKVKKRVMLVEDDLTIGAETMKMMNDFLKINDYEGVWAKNGKEALAIYHKNKRWFGLKQNNLRCILLDLRMPEMDGVEFVKALRKIENRNIFARTIPVVFVTGWEDEEKWQTAIDSFVAAYIKKPITTEKLKEVLSSIIHYTNAENMALQTSKEGIEKIIKFDEEENQK
ncbi:MAG: response regulator [Candidatus Margulisiibacteriota bacterium]|jgi:CheY-like chemotaxis protein